MTSPLLRTYRDELEGHSRDCRGEVVDEPTLEALVDYDGDKMASVPESTPHPTAVKFNGQRVRKR